MAMRKKGKVAFLAMTIGLVYLGLGDRANSPLSRYPLRCASIIGTISWGTSLHFAECEGGSSWSKSRSMVYAEYATAIEGLSERLQSFL